MQRAFVLGPVQPDMKRAFLLTALVAAGCASMLGPVADPSHGALRPELVLDAAETVTFVGPRLGPGMPLATAKPPYPEECGLGNPAPFSAFCDVIPLTVEIPADARPSDDIRLQLWLTWGGTGGTSNLDFWLWDDRQDLAGKQPVPDFEGVSSSWTPAEALTESTLLKAGSGGSKPEYMEQWEPCLRHYNIVVANFNSQASPQPRGHCPVGGGPAGCYVIDAKLEIIPYEPPFEITGP